MLQSALNLVLVVLGFGLVIIVHELGHFVAARWAGVRVLQFAVGFGTAILSYRKGLGWLRGSSAREYASLPAERAKLVSPTEYRLNWFPLGGYVKMLGQDDLAPTPAALAANPDSYSAAPVHKRMVIISAGVVMNLILAASLFILVFMAGLRVESSVVGEVMPGSAAATARVAGAGGAGSGAEGEAQGLVPGDRIESINGKEVRSFNDVVLHVAMAHRDRPLRLRVARGGETLALEASPKVSGATGLLELGVFPASSATLLGAASATPEGQAIARRAFDRAGLVGVALGSTVTEVGGKAVSFAHELERAVEAAKGEPVEAVFAPPTREGEPGGAGAPVRVALRATPRLHVAPIVLGEGSKASLWPAAHVLGIAAPVAVDAVSSQGEQSGLRAGDVLARVGALVWPDAPSAVAEIRRHARKPIDLVVVREGARVALRPTVSPQGTIGFSPRAEKEGDARGVRTAGILTKRHPGLVQAARTTLAAEDSDESLKLKDAAPMRPAAAAAALAGEGLALPPGSVITRVGETPVRSFGELALALREATAAGAARGEGAEVTLEIVLPLENEGEREAREAISWALDARAAESLHALGWESPVDASFFELARTTLKADGPLSAVGMGVRETNRVMMTTYLTLRRLYEGSVKVEHLKGPVGIAHLGTMVASQGFLHLLFFLALISVNLAVINFLPLPIVDGGQFVFLLIEGATRKPVSASIQNAAILVGVALIGVMFLVVTFNDVANLVR